MSAGPAGEAARQRRDLFYSGRVQGVGFRYTTCQIAARYRVAGYVQNLSDGRVRLAAEGEAAELDAFVGAVEQELGRYIQNIQSRSSKPTGEFGGFEIHF
ncbi:MAG TPA: acylphosphatase [Pirellulales bacterium]|nr:acylphosphatase [Pirellulales bacterium]